VQVAPALAPTTVQSTPPTLRVRRSVRELQAEYDGGNTKPLEDLLRAWVAIQRLPPTDPKSFFALGGLHGAPFDLRPEVDALSDADYYAYWGGWCHHGNVLFPPWHRLYVLKIEEALRAQVPDVVMPYWDETSEESLAQGIPAILTQEKVMLDGRLIDNPLCSFTFPVEVRDEMAERSKGLSYSKPAGYTTVRYPFSGLAGTPEQLAEAERHNARFQGRDTTALLNENIRQFLQGPQPQNVTSAYPKGVAGKYRVLGGPKLHGLLKHHLCPEVQRHAGQ
jgi:tyrosinase